MTSFAVSFFALAVEPLAASIRHSVYQGFKSGNIEEKNFYADGTLIYLGDAVQSLVSLVYLVQVLGCSGFVINWDNLVLLPIDSQELSLPPCENQISVLHSFN